MKGARLPIRRSVFGTIAQVVVAAAFAGGCLETQAGDAPTISVTRSSAREVPVQSGSECVVTISPDAFWLGFPDESTGEIPVGAVPNTVPDCVIAEECAVVISTRIGERHLNWDVPVRDDGSVRTTIGPFQGRDLEQVFAARFVLEVQDAHGRRVAGIDLGPMMSADRSRVAVVRGRASRVVIGDGVLLEFDGDCGGHDVGMVTVRRHDGCVDRQLIAEQFDLLGCWEVETEVLKPAVRRDRAGRPIVTRFDPHERFEPGVRLSFPVPDDLPDGALVLGLDRVRGHVSRARNEILRLRNAYRVDETPGRRVLVPGARFEVRGCDDGRVGSHLAVHDAIPRSIDGRHVLVVDSSRTVTLAVGTYLSGRFSRGGWRFDETSEICWDPESPLGIAAAARSRHAVQRHGSTLELVIPVIADQPFGLTIRDTTTGWSLGSVPFGAVAGVAGTMQYIGDLDEKAERARVDNIRRTREERIREDQEAYQ